MERPRVASSRASRDGADRGSSQSNPGSWRAESSRSWSDPAPSETSARSAANLLGLAWRVGLSMSHRSPPVPHMFLLRIRIIPQIALTSKGGVPGCALRPRGPFGHRCALGAIRVDVGAVPASMLKQCQLFRRFRCWTHGRVFIGSPRTVGAAGRRDSGV